MPKWLLPAIWILKAFFAYLYCEYQNGIDTHGYFGNGKYVSNLFFEQPLHFLELVFFPSARGYIPEHLAEHINSMGYWHNSQTYFMVRVHAMLNLFTFSNFHTNALFIAFFSFIGLTAIAKTILRVHPELSYKKVLPVLLVPSVLYWSSGGHKDGWILFAFGLSLYFFYDWLRNYKKWYSLFMAVMLVLSIMMVRQYVVFFLAPFFTSWMWLHFYPKRYKLKTAFIWIFWFVGMAFVRIPVLNMTYLDAIKDKYFQFQALAMGNTHFHLQTFEIGLFQILLRIPESIFNVLVRPVTMISNGTFQTIVAIESLLILGWLVAGIWFIDFRKKYPFVTNLFILSIAIFMLIGFIVPNLGAQSRYRIFSLPIFLVFFSVYSKNKLLK